MLVRSIGGKDSAQCNRGLYRLSTDTDTWTALERGLLEQVAVRCLTLHPEQPGVVFAGTQAGSYCIFRSAGAAFPEFPGVDRAQYACLCSTYTGSVYDRSALAGTNKHSLGEDLRQVTEAGLIPT
jgi:hypothetical protein